jgi:hypothetical protein
LKKEIRKGATTLAIQKRSKTAMVYQMKVSLMDIEPPIWRRFLVTSDQTLHRLHLILQSIMGWDNYHLYDFRIDDIPYGEKFEEYEPGMRQSHRYKLGDVIHSEGQKFLYTYDYGDDWLHEIVVGKISPADPEGLYPVCLAGERASPVEDCGGVTGYYDLLEAIRNADREEHESMITWARRNGVDYDPEECNLKSINRELRFYWPKGRRWSYPLATSLVNRHAAIVKPKEPFLQWLKNTPDWDLNITLEDLRLECMSILIPDFDGEQEQESFMEAIHQAIFEMELDAWYRDEAVWPKDRDYDLFKKWFDVEVHPMVIDTIDEEMEKEDF